MKTIKLLIIVLVFALCLACQKQPAPLTDKETQQVIDSTTYIIQTLMDTQSGDPKFGPSTIAIFRHYHANDPDIRHIGHGVLQTSLDSMFNPTEASVIFRETVELFETKPDRFDVVVLSRDAASVTVPTHWKMKVKGVPEYAGTEMLSFILQKRKGRWLIIQSHISDPNICEALATLMPKPDDGKK